MHRQLILLLLLHPCFNTMIPNSYEICDWDIYDCIIPYDMRFTYKFMCYNNQDCPSNFKCCSHRCFRHNICQPSQTRILLESIHAIDHPGECNILISCGFDLPRSFTEQFKCLQDDDCPDHYKCCYIECYNHKVCQPAKNEYTIDTTRMTQVSTSETIPSIETTVNTTVTEDDGEVPAEVMSITVTGTSKYVDEISRESTEEPTTLKSPIIEEATYISTHIPIEMDTIDVYTTTKRSTTYTSDDEDLTEGSADRDLYNQNETEHHTTDKESSTIKQISKALTENTSYEYMPTTETTDIKINEKFTTGMVITTKYVIDDDITEDSAGSEDEFNVTVKESDTSEQESTIQITTSLNYTESTEVPTTIKKTSKPITEETSYKPIQEITGRDTIEQHTTGTTFSTRDVTDDDDITEGSADEHSNNPTEAESHTGEQGSTTKIVTSSINTETTESPTTNKETLKLPTEKKLSTHETTDTETGEQQVSSTELIEDITDDESNLRGTESHTNEQETTTQIAISLNNIENTETPRTIIQTSKPLTEEMFYRPTHETGLETTEQLSTGLLVTIKDITDDEDITEGSADEDSNLTITENYTGERESTIQTVTEVINTENIVSGITRDTQASNEKLFVTTLVPNTEVNIRGETTANDDEDLTEGSGDKLEPTTYKIMTHTRGIPLVNQNIAEDIKYSTMNVQDIDFDFESSGDENLISAENFATDEELKQLSRSEDIASASLQTTEARTLPVEYHSTTKNQTKEPSREITAKQDYDYNNIDKGSSGDYLTEIETKSDSVA